MPELPEVETIVRDLGKQVLHRTFVDVWTDFKRMIKKPDDFGQFKKEIKGKKIKKVWRRGKNIIFDLSGRLSLLVHQKLTGHLLLGRWRQEKGQWSSLLKGPLAEDPRNRFLHLIFWLDNGQQLALSDLRKFAKVELLNQEELKKELSSFGPEPLEKKFTFEKFLEILKNKKGKVKQVLMDQTVIAGIGNIYSDEILWTAKIHPFKDVSKLPLKELKAIYLAISRILRKATKLKGDSMSDYRLLSGEKGGYQEVQRVYRREGKSCYRCGSKIKRVKLAGRSAHFCPSCQRAKRTSSSSSPSLP